MDSLTQITLGSAIGVAVMGRRTQLWKAALWGGICGTMPDLDAFIDHGDPVSNMTFHRAESHALFYQTLVSPLIAAIPARLHAEWRHFRHWWLAVWLILITHALLDLMTVYGTQIALPFTDFPFAVGSVFIIDPLYTVPLLIGVIAALRLRNDRGLRWNQVGLALSTLYLLWSVVAQQWVLSVTRDSLAASGIQSDRILVTPTPFNTVLWRVVALTSDGYVEGFYSLFDPERRIHFDAFPNGGRLREQLGNSWHVNRMAWFSRGFFKMTERDGRVLMSDIRFGQEPFYNFTFVVAERRSEELVPRVPVRLPPDRNVGPLLAWLRQRIGGNPIPPPR